MEQTNPWHSMCFAGRRPGRGFLPRSANRTEITYDPTGRREDDGKGREALLAVFLIFLPVYLLPVLSLRSALRPSLFSPFSRLRFPLSLHLLVPRRTIATTHRDLVGHDGHEQRVERQDVVRDAQVAGAAFGGCRSRRSGRQRLQGLLPSCRTDGASPRSRGPLRPQ